MNRFSDYLWERKKEKGYIFIPYLGLGDPDWETSTELVDILIESGADSIELGLPFSDPSADGPVLQRAFRRSLEHDFSYEKFLDFLKELHAKYPDFLFTVMGYANVFYAHGLEETLRELYANGAGAVVIPDIPFDETPEMTDDMPDWVYFITPTTRQDRLEQITKNASAFIYFVSYKGTTGQSDFSLDGVTDLINELKEKSSVPVVTGFGIRERVHATQAIEKLDGFIVGSRLHEVIEKYLGSKPLITSGVRAAVNNILP